MCEHMGVRTQGCVNTGGDMIRVPGLYHGEISFTLLIYHTLIGAEFLFDHIVSPYLSVENFNKIF